MAPVTDEKTPPDGLNARCAATQRAVEAVEMDVGGHAARLAALEIWALPSTRVLLWAVLAALVVGFLLGLIVGGAR